MPSPEPTPRRLAVLGTPVRDRIFAHNDLPPHEGWGGITYSLAAASAALPAGWELLPVLKVGEDHASELLALVGSLPGVAPDFIPLVVPGETDRVELRYHDSAQRRECLSLGVPPWSWEELAPRLEGVDVLYVNFITGFEIALTEAERLRGAVGGLLHADLHSLLLHRTPEGYRYPRQLPERERWARCFDTVQLNEEELRTLAGGEDPDALVRRMLAGGVGCVAVTRGERGAVCHYRGTEGEVIRAEAEGERLPGDPTGCGDVWGATFFCRLAAGDAVSEALAAAQRAAARKLSHQGVEGLQAHLREDGQR